MTWLWIVLAVVVVAAGALVPLARRERGTGGGTAEIAARDRYELLGHYVEDPAATTDSGVAALLHQARERWDSAGSILATAKTAADFELAGQVVGEGLAHVRTAHRKLGIPGPPE